MKVGVSSTGKDLEASVDTRFGRCAFFIVVNTDDMSYEAFDNEYMTSGEGAGIKLAESIISKGAEVVITWKCGPKAMKMLTTAGVEVIENQTGKINQLIQYYKEGKLKSSTEPNVQNYHGKGVR
ncbi:MAG: NifB/NifX family molybdenum-iron cluster-binding protein [Thermodesulfobacteriota bacterium]|nr:NifB/NifX family molybdenum-iron cluster-binding protein [Thermodesulfobacteriota bacterium]